MARFISILILSYYVAVNLCLPQGDFSAVVDLPQMYRHCKSTEDKDMTPFDFVTDHLINIDGLFDKHENGDKQKPHSPVQFHHQQIQNYFATNEFKVIQTNYSAGQESAPAIEENIYFSDILSFVFRPPIV
ncbi:MAG: hypothetical protein ABI763_15765 [Bacteroidota bacterium]